MDDQTNQAETPEQEDVFFDRRGFFEREGDELIGELVELCERHQLPMVLQVLKAEFESCRRQYTAQISGGEEHGSAPYFLYAALEWFPVPVLPLVWSGFAERYAAPENAGDWATEEHVRERANHLLDRVARCCEELNIPCYIDVCFGLTDDEPQRRVVDNWPDNGFTVAEHDVLSAVGRDANFLRNTDVDQLRELLRRAMERQQEMRERDARDLEPSLH